MTKLLAEFVARLLPHVLSVIVCTLNFNICNIGAVNAAQLSCGNDPVLLGGQYPYTLIQVAYDDITPEGIDTIRLQAVEFGESLILDQNVTVTLKGGYDCFYNEPPVLFSIIDSMIISNGTIVVANIILRDVNL